MTAPKVCVIGAGSSGLTTIKALLAQQVPFDCFEMGSDIGGNWRFNNDNGRSAAYRSLHIDTSKERMQFSDFPMPAEYPNYPHHTQVLAYFERYAEHFGLRPHITFRTEVVSVTPAAGGGYSVTTRHLPSGQTHTALYRAVVVCNGHHWQPRWPAFPGDFQGNLSHSHTYREPQPYLNRRVLVVGIGNSATDIACEVARLAARTYLSTRRSAYIIPRYLLGRPTDKWLYPAFTYLPWVIQRFFYWRLLRLGVGNQEQYGVPYPSHPLLSEHPTMSADLLNLVSLGEVVLKPNVAELCGDAVRFEDGSLAKVDAIIYATGYQVAFPFLAPTLFQTQDNEVALYRYVVAPNHPGLYFIGLIQPLGAIMPLAERQAIWVADILAGRSQLPTPTVMRREIVKARAYLRRRYVLSPRHTLQVDFYPYQRLLDKEIRAGRQRQARAAR